MKILTLPQAVSEIKELDSHSAVNEAFLKHLIREKLLRFGNRGIRTVVDLDEEGCKDRQYLLRNP